MPALRLCEVPDLQLGRASAADHEEIGHRKRPHFFSDFFRIQSMYLSGLFEITGHLCQNLGCGDSYVYSEAEGFQDPVPDERGSLFGRGIAGRDGSKIQIAFVNGYLLQLGRKFFGEKLDHSLAVTPVKLVVGRLHDEAGTFAQGGCYRLPGLNSIFFCRDRFSQHDAVAAFLISADNRGNRPQVGFASVFQLFQGSPAQISGVDVDVENNVLPPGHLQRLLSVWAAPVHKGRCPFGTGAE